VKIHIELEALVKWYPDIEILNSSEEISYFFEIKFQRRTFMSVSKLLPESILLPSETIALNLSDLLRYFEIKKQVKCLYS